MISISKHSDFIRLSKKFIFTVSLIFVCALYLSAQQKTYCNPINIDYGYGPIPDFVEWGKHRTTADPVIVSYKGD